MEHTQELRLHILNGEMGQLPPQPEEGTDEYDTWLRTLFSTVACKENTAVEMYAIMNNLVLHTKRFCYVTAGHYIQISGNDGYKVHHYSDWFRYSLGFLMFHLERRDFRFTSGKFPHNVTWNL